MKTIVCHPFYCGHWTLKGNDTHCMIAGLTGHKHGDYLEVEVKGWIFVDSAASGHTVLLFLRN